MEVAEVLQQTALFGGCSEDEIASVLGTAKERPFEPGEAIIEEGREGGRGFYLLLEGTAEARKGDTVLAEFAQGDYFGEMALLLDDTARTADVVATSAARCLVITQWDLKAMIAAHPEVGVTMMGELAKRLRNTDAAISD